MNLETYFERVYCVNLRRRPDRRERMLKQLDQMDWPFKEIEWVPAVDGQLCRPPQWFRGGRGAWGCYRTHVNLMERCLNDGVNSVLLLEDDADFMAGFPDKVREFLEAVPNDWEMLYLGGQHLKVSNVPTPVEGTNDKVFQPFNVNRTHAWALRGRGLLETYQHCCRKDWTTAHHIDHHCGRIHQRRDRPIYVPPKWLVGQAEGKSNINGREVEDRVWNHAADVAKHDPNTQPFIAVVGLHSSGSSALAGVLYHLGVHMGNNLVGYYGSDPTKRCGFEAVGLRDLCERAIPFPLLKPAVNRSKMYHTLRDWINAKRREASQRGTVAGGKYPMLCRFHNQLINICGSNLRVVVADRPLHESVDSLVRRCKNQQWTPEQLADHQMWLEGGKQQLMEMAQHVTIVNYHDLIDQPGRTIGRLIESLQLEPSDQQRKAAIKYVDPTQRHFGGKDAEPDSSSENVLSPLDGLAVMPDA